MRLPKIRTMSGARTVASAEGGKESAVAFVGEEICRHIQWYESSRNKRNAGTSRALSFTSELKNAPKESLPKFVPPQLALQVTEAPDGSEWIHELKLDGYRMQGRIDAARGKAPDPQR